MMTKNNQKKRLTLNKLTVCRLTASEESKVLGGEWMTKSGVSCKTCDNTMICQTTTGMPTHSCNC